MNTNTTNELSNQAPGNPFAVQASAGGGALAAMTSNAAVTSVLASIWIAKQFPRDLAEVTARMNQACSRLTLAQSATYAFPRGGTTVEGPSIRLAEALIGAWGIRRPDGRRLPGTGIQRERTARAAWFPSVWRFVLTRRPT